MIPKVVHHSAPKNRGHWHHIWGVCFETWREEFPEPEYEHILWDDDKIDCFIDERFPEFSSFYRALPFHIVQLDFFRFALLYAHGGIYADMDMFCVNNFYSKLNKDVAVVNSPYVEGQLENSLMAAAPGNPHFLALMNSCVETFEKLGVREEIVTSEGCEYVFQLCGPEQIRNYYNRLAMDAQLEFQILDHELFNPDALEVNGDNLEDHFTVHLNTGNWGRDFTEYMLNGDASMGRNYQHATFNHWKYHSPVWARHLWDIVVPQG